MRFRVVSATGFEPVASAVMLLKMSAGRPVVVAAGTGRPADLLSRRSGATARHAPRTSGQVRSAVTSGLVHILDPDGPVAARREQLRLLLRQG